MWWVLTVQHEAEVVLGAEEVPVTAAAIISVFQRADHQYPKLDFTQADLQERFKRQLSMERACSITINSVEAAKPITENMTKMVNRPTHYLPLSYPRLGVMLVYDAKPANTFKNTLWNTGVNN